MLVCFWSPKGGSGTSVVAAAAALLVARERAARLADLAGDQPAVLACPNDPEHGLRDWLRAGPAAPSDAIERLGVEISPRLVLLPAGTPGLAEVSPETGAALAMALADDPRTTIADAGRLDSPALLAFSEVADVNVVVVRGCYLALRRAVQHEALAHVSGAIVVDEHGRTLGARDVADVLGVPVLASIEARTSTARTVDAGVLATRLPDSLTRPLRRALQRAGCLDDERAA